MPGLVPGIHVFLACRSKTWMAGINPAMTTNVKLPMDSRSDDRAERQRAGGSEPDRGEIDPVISERAAQRPRDQRRPQQQIWQPAEARPAGQRGRDLLPGLD